MDKTRQGILNNHDNEFLHYEDDWYILAAKDQKYVVVYYRGNNDAWDGYGGAVVYTREPAFPKEFIPEVREAVEKVEKEIVKDVVAVEKEIVKDLGQVEQEVEKDVK